MQAGAERTSQQDPAKVAKIENFIEPTLSSYSVLPLDTIVFRESVRLIHGNSREVTEDAMIAAKVRLSRLTVVIRNVKNFVSLNVRVLDPFTYSRRQT